MATVSNAEKATYGSVFTEAVRRQVIENRLTSIAYEKMRSREVTVP